MLKEARDCCCAVRHTAVVDVTLNGERVKLFKNQNVNGLNLDELPKTREVFDN